MITVNFPPCPWSGDVTITGHVDVWTTIPAIPIIPVFGISTGFTMHMLFSDGPQWTPNPDVNCYEGHGAVELEDKSGEPCGSMSIEDCEMKCFELPSCQGVTVTPANGLGIKTGSVKCFRRGNITLDQCDHGGFTANGYDTWLKGGPPLLNLKVGLSQPAGKGADPEQDKCALDLNAAPEYPPQGDNWTIPTYTIDLDLDPKDRWTKVVAPRSKDILAMIEQFINSVLRAGSVLNNKLLSAILDLGTDALLKKIPSPFDDEIRGVAKATGIHVTYIFVYNIMYELAGFCSSLVAQDSQGHIYHARNLDFGEFMGTDPELHSWELTKKLKPLLMNLNFVRGGVTLYQSTQYAGFVGLLTGLRKGAFSISVDTRFDGNLDKFLLMWLLGKYDGQFLSWKTRAVMENFGTYADALNALSNYKPMGPGYIILGGARAKEGAVLQLGANRNTPLLIRSLADKNDTYYVAQTNYDWPAAPPAFDDRRYPLLDCLNKIGNQGMSFKNLWGVMSSNPTRNAGTTYTTLMSAETGHFEAYKQFCAPGPSCMPFMGTNYMEVELKQKQAAVMV
jgi:acid ceramidase